MKSIKYFVTILFSCFFLIGCESGIFFPSESGIREELKGTWVRYTFSDIGDTDIWTIDDNYVISNFIRDGFPANSDTSTYSVRTKINSAYITIDKDMNDNFFNKEWEIIKIKSNVLELSLESPPRLLEFVKL